MFETSKDFLNIAIGSAVFLLAVFASWAIYYLARILQQGFRIIKEMRDRLHKFDELIKAVKEKIEHSTSYLLLIGEGVKKLVEIGKKYVDNKERK
jgi:CHASE3 domain sensor protein